MNVTVSQYMDDGEILTFLERGEAGVTPIGVHCRTWEEAIDFKSKLQEVLKKKCDVVLESAQAKNNIAYQNYLVCGKFKTNIGPFVSPESFGLELNKKYKKLIDKPNDDYA